MSDEELNEVVVSGEVNKPNVVVVIDDDDDDGEDDDCVVLEGDPENQVKCLNDSSTGSDELLVVGEKGKIACRDYPHPRHLCANFPYSSTPHERHCSQCHCYVCDSPAPCLKWGNGLLTTDHCHATDKLSTWKKQREDSKLVKTAPLPASTKCGTLGDGVNSQHNNILPLDTARLSSNAVSMNWATRSTASRPLSVNPVLQNKASQPITMNACSSLRSSLQNQASRSTESNTLSGNLVPPNLASYPISTNGLSLLNSILQTQASLMDALKVNRTPQNQASWPITMNALSSQGPRSQNQASRSTTLNPLSVNPIPQKLASQPISTNFLSSFSSTLQNQASVTQPLSVNLTPQNQASQPITMNALSFPSSSLQVQTSTPNSIPERSSTSNFSIPNGATNGRYQEIRSTLATNKYPSNTIQRTSLGVRDHAIQKNRGHNSLGPQCTKLDWINSVGSGNTAAMNHVTPLGASGFNNHVNLQNASRYCAAAATKFSNSRNCYGQNGDWITKAVNSLPTQPNNSPAPAYGTQPNNSPAPVYGTQPCYPSNNRQDLYGYSNIQGNDSFSSYVARLNQNRHSNENQIGSQNGNAGGNIINSGVTMQDNILQQKPHGGIQNGNAGGNIIINSGASMQDIILQQKPHDGIQNEICLANDSSLAESENTNQNISYVQNLVSENIPPNSKESSSPFTGNTFRSLDDLKHYLLDSS